MAHDPLPELLVRAGAASQQEIARSQGNEAAILALGRRHERKLCEILARSERHPAIALSSSTLDLAASDLLPERISGSHLILPVAVDAETLTVAVASTELGHVLDQISFTSGRRLTLLLAVKELLRALIPVVYASRRLGEDVLVGEHASRDEPHLDVVRFVEQKEEAELAKLMAGLNGSLQLLRGAARVKTQAQSIALQEPARSEVPRETPVPVPMPPLAPAAPPPTDVPLSEAPVVPGSPIALIVEDDGSIRSLVARVLFSDGWSVIETASGIEAVQHLRHTKPSLVVLDAMLPGVHGFEICSRLKASSYRDVPVIMMSAVYRGWEQAREVQERHGADAFLEKPFNVQLLRRMAARYLGREPAPTSLPDERRALVHELQRQAEAAVRVGRWEDAMVALRRWLEVNPFDAIGHLQLGNALTQRGALDAAMRAYEAALVCDDHSFPAAVNLATTYERLGFQRKSRETWHKARTLADDDRAREMIDARLARA